MATRGSRNDIIRMRVDGSPVPPNLSDLSLMMRLIPGVASRTPGDRIAEILDRYTLAFFDEYVLETGTRSPLLDGPVAEFPEVTFQTFGRRFEGRRPPVAVGAEDP